LARPCPDAPLFFNSLGNRIQSLSLLMVVRLHAIRYPSGMSVARPVRWTRFFSPGHALQDCFDRRKIRRARAGTPSEAGKAMHATRKRRYPGTIYRSASKRGRAKKWRRRISGGFWVSFAICFAWFGWPSSFVRVVGFALVGLTIGPQQAKPPRTTRRGLRGGTLSSRRMPIAAMACGA